MLKEVFALFILLKIGFSGLFCNYSLNRINCEENNSAYGSIVFSTLYALCSWMVGYYWNIMWLDTFAVFPLVALGIYLLVKEKKYKLYTVSLTIAIFANYYIGFMICIFTAIYFFVQCILNKNSIKELLLNLKNIIVFSLISIMISAITIIPTIIALQNVYKRDYTLDTLWTVSRGWIEALSNSFAYVNATSYGGLPNLYCGVACIVFLFAFYRLSQVSRKEKIVYSILILFFYISTNVKILDYAWHGFHFTNSLPYRFTFMLSFLIVMLSYKAYCDMESLNKTDFLIMCVISAVYFLAIAVDKLSRYAKDNNLASIFEALQADDPEMLPLLVKNFLLIAAYLILIFLFIKRKFSKKLFTLCFAVIVAIELVPTVLSGTESVRKTDRNTYPDKYNEVQDILADIESKEDNKFYRVELTKYYTLNAPLLYGYNGLSTFTSTARVAVTDLFENMGLQASQAGNRYYYQNATPVINAFLNLKYLISREGEVANKEYLTEVKENENVYAYENDAYLPIGFMVDSGMADFHFDGDTPFDKQNNLIKAATGIDKNVFDLLEVIHVGHKNVEVTKSGYGCYNYKPVEGADAIETEQFRYNYEMPSDGCAYVYMNLSEAKTVSVEFNGEDKTYDLSKPSVFPAGTYKKGDIFTVKTEVDAGKSGTANIYVSVLNQEVFDQAYDILKDETLDVARLTSRGLKGTITAKTDGLMYTSIPYEEGWNVYVDDVKTEVELIDDAFIAIPLSGGEHRIELKYSPKHVYLSAFLSVLGIAALSGICIAEKRKYRFVSALIGKK